MPSDSPIAAEVHAIGQDQADFGASMPSDSPIAADAALLGFEPSAPS
jgi:hypothetical protein